MPEINERQIKVKDLIRVLPQEALADIAKNLVKDITEVPPPFFGGGGDSLYTHGSLTIWFSHGGNGWGDSVQVTVDPEFGKRIVGEIIDWEIDIEMEEKAEAVGIGREELVNRIGLFILSNVNMMNDAHNCAIELFRQIGVKAWESNEGTMDSSEISSYMEDTIDRILDDVDTPQEKYYWSGVRRHLQAYKNSDMIFDIEKSIEIFNSAVEKYEGNYDIVVDTESSSSLCNEVVEEVVNYLTNPLNFFQANPELEVDLRAYEQAHGKLPRQYDLPGLLNE